MKKMKKFFIILAVIILVFILFYFGLYVYAKLSPGLPINGANGYHLYDSEELAFNGDDNEWVKLDNISKNIRNATVSIEDKNFYKHLGFDYLRIIKALMINVKSGANKQGASTITQQYSKNLFLDFDKTWSRKLKEAWITIRLETHYSKDEILEGYLNTINYGGIFGIENAAKYYFDKKASELSLAEASMLAGIPKNPSRYSPITHPKEAKERQKLILASMVDNGYITEKEMKRALNEELNYAQEKDDNKSSMIMYYQDAVMKELEKIDSIPTSFLETGGLKIYTNLDSNAQKVLEENINKNIKSENIQSAAIMMDPNTGKVLALTGGMNYSKSQFNRALSENRQVGSTIKPFLYYSALENGFTPSTTFTSEKTNFSLDNGKTYSPKNYNDEYAKGPISMATALAYSDNIYAVKTHLFLGQNSLVNMLKRVGISKNVKELPALALGAEEISLIDMMGAYSTLANEGNKIKPHFISKVTDIEGNILYEYKPKPENILNKSTVYVLNELLTSTYAKEFIDYNYPTCYGISSKMTKKYAIKTGTTDTDNLIFGYNKDILVGMWTGYDNNKNVNGTDSSNIKNAWIDTIEGYLKDKKDNWYKTPSNVVGVAVNPLDGTLSNGKDKSRIQYYIKGTEPSSNKSLDESIPTVKME